MRKFIKGVIYDYIHSRYAVCQDCGCLVDKRMVQTVVVYSACQSGFGERYYCGRDKKPYDAIQRKMDDVLSFLKRKYGYTHQFYEVTEKGKKIE